MHHLTPEQCAALPAIMEHLMRSCSHPHGGDWRTVALAYRISGTSYADLIRALSQSIGCCGYRDPGGYGYDFMQQSLSAEVRIRLPGQDWFTLKRGAFLRFVFPDPIKPQQLSFF